MRRTRHVGVRPLNLGPRPVGQGASRLRTLIRRRTVSLFRGPRHNRRVIGDTNVGICAAVSGSVRRTTRHDLAAHLTRLRRQPSCTRIHVRSGSSPHITRRHCISKTICSISGHANRALICITKHGFRHSGFSVVRSKHHPTNATLLPFLCVYTFSGNCSPYSHLISSTLSGHLTNVNNSRNVLNR